MAPARASVADQEPGPSTPNRRRGLGVVRIGPPGAAEGGPVDQSDEERRRGDEPDGGGDERDRRQADEKSARAQRAAMPRTRSGGSHTVTGLCTMRRYSISASDRPTVAMRLGCVLLLPHAGDGEMAADGAVERPGEHGADEADDEARRGAPSIPSADETTAAPADRRRRADRREFAESEVDAPDEAEDEGIGCGEQPVDRGPRQARRGAAAGNRRRTRGTSRHRRLDRRLPGIAGHALRRVEIIALEEIEARRRRQRPVPRSSTPTRSALLGDRPSAAKRQMTQRWSGRRPARSTS